MHRCVVCGLAAKHRCGGCSAVPYCSRKCQRANWAVHVEVCALCALLAKVGVVPHHVGVAAAAAALPKLRLCTIGLSVDDALRPEALHFDVRPPASVLDHASYRLVRLGENGLRVLLVSDFSNSQAAAALDLAVGAGDNPPELAGLSHLVEHMLFLGTRTHPTPSSFNDFLNASGGSSNAYTAVENTCFYFEARSQNIEEALSWFGEFFREPTLQADMLDRELLAVNAEHAKNLPLEERRLHIIVTAASRLRALSNFSTGSLETLRDAPRRAKIDVHARMVEHARAHYLDADTMRLCVVAPLRLDELERVVASAFSRIASSTWRSSATSTKEDRTRLCESEDETLGSVEAAARLFVHPYDEAARARIVWVEAAEKARFLSAQFSMPPLHRLCNGALELLSHAITSAARGSLRDALEREQLALDVSASTDGALRRSLIYSVRVQLTPRGLANVGRVLDLLFAFVEALASPSVTLFSYDSYACMAQQQRTVLQYTAMDSPSERAAALATALRQRGTDVLHETLYVERASYSESDMRQMLRYLRAENARIYVVAPMRELSETRAISVLPERNENYGVRWRDDALASIMKRSSSASAPFFKLEVRPCLYDLGETLSLVSSPAHAYHERAQALRQLVGSGFVPFPRPWVNAPGSSPNLVVWHKQDEFYATPRLNIRLMLVLPAMQFNAAHSNAAGLVYCVCSRALSQRLSEAGAVASFVGATLLLHGDGIEVRVQGFAGASATNVARALALALDVIALAARASAVDRELAAAQLRQLYESTLEGESFRRATRLLGDVQSAGALQAHVLLREIDAGLERYDELARQLRSPATRAIAFVHGNIEARHAHTLVSECIDALRRAKDQDGLLAPALAQIPDAWLESRIIKAPRNVHTVYAVSPSACDVAKERAPASSIAPSAAFQHCLAFDFQCGLSTPETRAALMLAQALLVQPLYNEMRTRLNLCYIIMTEDSYAAGTAALRVVVQSSATSPAELERKLLAAVRAQLAAALEGPDAERIFSEKRKQLLATQTWRNLTLEGATEEAWNEIVQACRSGHSLPDSDAACDLDSRRGPREPHLLAHPRLEPIFSAAAPGRVSGDLSTSSERGDVQGFPASMRRTWPLFERQLYLIVALANLSLADFLAFTNRTFTDATRRRTIAVHMHDPVDSRTQTLLPNASLVHQGEERALHASSYLYPLVIA